MRRHEARRLNYNLWVRISFVTLFPDHVLAAMRYSILERAEQSGRVQFDAVNPRDFADDPHRTVDDSPFGGGPGMVLKPDRVAEAVDSVLTETAKVITFEPWGKLVTDTEVRRLAKIPHLVLVSGHYEGLDGRIAQYYDAETYCIGDFVVSGGEFPALLLADAVVRQVSGTLGNAESLDIDSFGDGLLTGPQFTRPWDFRGLTPPEILRSGDHAKIERFKRQQALKLTRDHRPDLFAKANLTDTDVKLILED